MLVLQTTYVSIAAQVLIGALDLTALTFDIPKEHQILKSILLLETVVQIVELCFYVYFVLRFNLEKMAATRYFDWVITTPTMLFTTIVFMEYHALLESNSPTADLTIHGFIADHKNDIATISAANFLMLLSGYLAEINVIPRPAAAIIGFAFLATSFSTIYHNYARRSKTGTNLFVFLAVIWSLYGFAFLLPTSPKNIAYNFLDVIAKNFFGLYLFFAVSKAAGIKK